MAASYGALALALGTHLVDAALVQLATTVALLRWRLSDFFALINRLRRNVNELQQQNDALREQLRRSRRVNEFYFEAVQNILAASDAELLDVSLATALENLLEEWVIEI